MVLILVLFQIGLFLKGSSSFNKQTQWSGVPYTPNAQIVVSVNGTDDENCGSSSDPCETVAHGCVRGSDVFVTNGRYEESDGVTVTEPLSITGESQTASLLSLAANSNITLFSLPNAGGALTLTDLTILLTLLGDGGHFLSSVAAPAVTVTVVLNRCRVSATAAGGSSPASVSGAAFFISNGGASLGFNNCTLVDLAVEDLKPLIYSYSASSAYTSTRAGAGSGAAGMRGGFANSARSGAATIADGTWAAKTKTSSSVTSAVSMVITTDTPDTPPDTINTLWFADTTVARVSNTLSNSLFMLGYVRNVTLVRSVFADSATMNPDFEASYSGLGYVVALTAVGACTACEFTNCTTANYAGVMLIISDTPYNSSFAIANTTCIRCSGMQTSTWLFAFVRLTVTDTSFHSCWSAAADDMYGGVLDIDQDCVATIERCLFYNCTGKYSGGVLGYMCTITITDCVFMRNHASGYDVLTEFGNDVFGMNVTSIEISGGYTDQPSYALSVGCETEVGTCSAWCVRDWCSEEKNVTCPDVSCPNVSCPESSGERNKKTVSAAVIWSLICVFVFMII